MHFHQATINTKTKIPNRSEFCNVEENFVAPPVFVVEGDWSIIGVGDSVGFSEVVSSLVLVLGGEFGGEFGGEELLLLLLSLLVLLLLSLEEEDVFGGVLSSSSSSSFSLFGVSLPGPP